MAVTYTIQFDVNPNQRDRFLTLLTGVLDAMRDEPMFHNAMLQQDAENENRFLLLETWESHDDVLNNQLNRPYRQAYHDALPELLNGPREITIWTPFRADYRQT
jgi:quinol monooxygenase YgiN